MKKYICYIIVCSFLFLGIFGRGDNCSSCMNFLDQANRYIEILENRVRKLMETQIALLKKYSEEVTSKVALAEKLMNMCLKK